VPVFALRNTQEARSQELIYKSFVGSIPILDSTEEKLIGVLATLGKRLGR